MMSYIYFWISILIDHCIFIIKVNSATAGEGDVQIEVRAPSGRSMNLSAVPRHGGNYISNFNPTEVGTYIFSDGTLEHCGICLAQNITTISHTNVLFCYTNTTVLCAGY